MKKLPIRLASLAQGKPRGQALLVVLLIMAVALTIGLAVTSRTVTDIEISEQTEEAARAFSAAEAGIEEALVTVGQPMIESPPDFGGEGVSFKTSRTDLGAESQYLFPESKEEVRTLWLAEYPDTQSYTGDSLILYWGNADSTDEPALEVTVYYQTGEGEYKVLRYALDPVDNDNDFCLPDDDTGIPRCENVIDFDVSTFPIGGATAKYKATLDLSSVAGTLLFARLRLLYSDELDQVLGSETASGNFPSQGVKIVSTGEAGGSTRKIEVVRLHPAPPGIFDFLLYSESDLVK